MAEEYAFKVKTCYCGTGLVGLTAVITTYRYGSLPSAKCPNCGRDMLLDAPAIEPVRPIPSSPITPAKKPVSAPTK